MTYNFIIPGKTYTTSFFGSFAFPVKVRYEGVVTSPKNATCIVCGRRRLKEAHVFEVLNASECGLSRICYVGSSCIENLRFTALREK